MRRRERAEYHAVPPAAQSDGFGPNTVHAAPDTPAKQSHTPADDELFDARVHTPHTHDGVHTTAGVGGKSADVNGSPPTLPARYALYLWRQTVQPSICELIIRLRRQVGESSQLGA